MGFQWVIVIWFHVNDERQMIDGRFVRPDHWEKTHLEQKQST